MERKERRIMKEVYAHGGFIPPSESEENWKVAEAGECIAPERIIKEAYKNTKNVSILGTIYTIQEQTTEENEHLKDADGYCDRTAKEIVIVDLTREKCTIKNPEWYRRKLLRHEIIHAFLFESGLGECTNWNDSTIHNEQMVDWFAIQFPKIQMVFEEVGCL